MDLTYELLQRCSLFTGPDPHHPVEFEIYDKFMLTWARMRTGHNIAVNENEYIYLREIGADEPADLETYLMQDRYYRKAINIRSNLRADRTSVKTQRHVANARGQLAPDQGPPPIPQKPPVVVKREPSSEPLSIPPAISLAGTEHDPIEIDCSTSPSESEATVPVIPEQSAKRKHRSTPRTATDLPPVPSEIDAEELEQGDDEGECFFLDNEDGEEGWEEDGEECFPLVDGENQEDSRSESGEQSPGAYQCSA